jgi:DNA-binding MarR family transcriptional regulator
MNAIEEAFARLDQILSGNQAHMMERMQRGGKGELFILKYLADRDAPVTPSQIGAVMNASNARISAALGSLEKKGQIRREIDTANRRNILVTLTPAGRERNHHEIRQIKQHLMGVLTEMGDRDAAELARLMKRFFDIANREWCK